MTSFVKPSESLERRLQDAYQLLEPERPLGVGGHGVVFPGVNRSSGEIMAIKQVSKKLTNSSKKFEALRRRVSDEAELLRVAGEHRSICSYKELFEGDDAWYIVTELARGGELFDRLVERGAYTATGAASVMRELVDAVAYLHQMGIAHLDLKPENVLLASDETDASDVRLVDFGSARFIHPDDDDDSSETSSSSNNTSSSAAKRHRHEEVAGYAPGATPAYAAPELLTNQSFDEKADMWSLGVILYLLLTGTHPFDPRNDADDNEVAKRVMAGAAASGAFDGPNWARVPKAARGLVKKMLATDKNDRPSAAEVSIHPWLVAPEATTLDDDADDETANRESRARAAVDALREFHRGRRRFKAMLLAVMLGYADDGLKRDDLQGTACLGSRRAAMEVFDADKDGIVTADDVKRVARYIGEDLAPLEIDEMMRALDTHCSSHGGGVPTQRLRHLLPPLYPAHSLQRGDVVFSAGEVDPRFYVLLDGDVLVSHTFTLRPRSGYVNHALKKQDHKKQAHQKFYGGRHLQRTNTSGYFQGPTNSTHDDGGHMNHSSRSSAPFAVRELSLGLHRLEPGQSFGETELLEPSVADALPRASTATCASPSCELLSIPGHLFQLLSDVFDGVQEPLRKQAEARAKSLVWSWVGALVAHSVGDDLAHGVATRSAFDPGDVAWSNRAYNKNAPLGRSLDLLHKHGTAGLAHRKVTTGGPFSETLHIKPSRFDAFLVVEDGVVDVTVADARTGARRVHTLWPRDFVYCNERPGNHPLDAKAEYSATVVVDVTAITHAQLAFVHGDVFQQALNQPAMHFVKIYLVDRFRELPPVTPLKLLSSDDHHLGSSSLDDDDDTSVSSSTSSSSSSSRSSRRPQLASSSSSPSPSSPSSTPSPTPSPLRATSPRPAV